MTKHQFVAIGDNPLALVEHLWQGYTCAYCGIMVDGSYDARKLLALPKAFAECLKSPVESTEKEIEEDRFNCLHGSDDDMILGY